MTVSLYSVLIVVLYLLHLLRVLFDIFLLFIEGTKSAFQTPGGSHTTYMRASLSKSGRALPLICFFFFQWVFFFFLM